MQCIKSYDILNQLNTDFKRKISKLYVYGSDGNQVLIITKDDLVYTFGDNENGCLGLNTDCVEYEEPVIVEELCRKSVCNISFGDNHVIALTTFGHLYSWGFNNFGQLGNDNQIDCFKPKIIENLIKEIVTEVSSGSDHTLVLTQTGVVFAFGYNQFGQIGNNSTQNVLKPIKVNAFDGENVIQISCGVYHSLALTESGRVFSWGNNFYRQLGIESTCDQLRPIQVNTNNLFIHKIICGSYHNLMLTIDGDIYAFGYNNCGQCGKSMDKDQIFPQKIDSVFKIVEIAASSHCFISVAFDIYNKGYVLGKYGSNTTSSLKSSHSSIEQIFANYSVPKITYKPLSFDEMKPFSLNESQINSFNEEIGSDLKIKIDNNYIYVHKSVLENRCEYFRSYLSHNWSQNKRDEIEINDFSFPVYYSFLNYLYKDLVEVSDTEHIIYLLELADFYCENELKLKCIEFMRKNITNQNVLAFYLTAKNHNLLKLKQFCFLYALKNFINVRKTINFKTMNEKLKSHFIERFEFRNNNNNKNNHSFLYTL